MPSHPGHLVYRRDIEGLRAIAILAVVAAHAKVPWLAGGFVGVDVFFVLSGYLITGLLVQEARATGGIRFAAFYARRFRRLLPALLLMWVCTSLLGAALLAFSDQPAQAIAAASAALWLSNFHFALSNLGYFSQSAETNLFLHTWSLGVEEQFYVIWPAFLLVVLGIWSGKTLAVGRGRLRIAMLLVFGISLLACVIQTASSPHLAFYLMPTRAWQFALGALVLLYSQVPVEVDGKDMPRLIQGGQSRALLIACVGWAGLGLIIVSALTLDTSLLYPGAWALLPAIGAAAVLTAGNNPGRAGVSTLLSLRPMQAIGRVSYAWYLWHWPVLLLGATLLNIDNGYHRFCLALLSLLIAVLSYRFVETPMRRNPQWVIHPRAAILVSLGSMILASALALRWHNSAIDYMAQPEQTRYAEARTATPKIYSMGCDDWYNSSYVRICAFGNDSATHTAVVIGDSIGLQWFPAIAEIFDKPDWRLLVLTKSSCPMVDEPIFYPRLGRDYTECAQWRESALIQVSALKPDIVILGSTYTYEFTPNQWVEGTTRVLQSISAATKDIYVLRSTPTLPFEGPSCLAPRSWLYSMLADRNRCTAPAQSALNDLVYKSLKLSADRFPNVHLVDMTNAVCPGGICRAEKEGMIVFRDSQHLSAAFAKSLAVELGKQLLPGDHDERDAITPAVGPN